MAQNIDQKIKKIFGNELRENVRISDYTTMKVGGPARFLYVAKKIEDLIKGVIFCQEEKIPYIVLGGGSNIIADDKGYDGMIILNRSGNISFISDKSQVIIDSGVSLMRLIVEAANRDFGGLENLYGIPGTVGGALYGNAGSHGAEITSFIKSVTLLLGNNKIIRVKPEWLEAGYRMTKLKKIKISGKNTPIILSVTLQLARRKKEEILRKLQYYKSLREEKQPYNFASAGSVFKNAGAEKEKTAGYILEAVGAKKLRVGGAEVSRKHANFVINAKDATSSDVKNLISEMKNLAHDKYGVELEKEVEYI